MQTDCYMYYPKGIEWGEIAVTRGHKLQCKYVFHGALPAYYMHLDETKKLTVSLFYFDLVYRVHISFSPLACNLTASAFSAQESFDRTSLSPHFLKKRWGLCERLRPSVRPSRYLLQNHLAEFNQTCYMTSPRGKGVRKPYVTFGWGQKVT